MYCYFILNYSGFLIFFLSIVIFINILRIIYIVILMTRGQRLKLEYIISKGDGKDVLINKYADLTRIASVSAMMIFVLAISKSSCG